MKLISYLFCLLFAVGNNLFAASPPTVQKVLPLPFCYFDNLYFDASSSTFLGYGTNIDRKKAILNQKDRGYSFKLTQVPPENSKLIPGTTLFLCENRGGGIQCLRHYFHLLEHIVGLWCLYGHEHAEDVRLIVLAAGGRAKKKTTSWKGPNELNLHLLKALFPNAKVKTWHAFSQAFSGKTLRFEHALTSDRTLTNNDPVCLQINKMLASARFDLSKEAMNQFANQIHAYSNTVFEKTGLLRVTYITRPPPRTLNNDIEEKLLQSIRMLKNVSLQVINLGKLSFQEQVRLIGNTDVLIGVHGNGLSHVLYLPEDAAAIEIFPPNSHALDFRLFGEARGVTYLSILPPGTALYSEDAYRIGCYGNTNHPIDDLDLMPILSFITEREKIKCYSLEK